MDTDRKLDLIYEEVDTLLTQNEFKRCDSLLRRLDIRSKSTDELLGYLIVTFPARSKLLYRNQFYIEVVNLVQERKENEEGLFNGLE